MHYMKGLFTLICVMVAVAACTEARGQHAPADESQSEKLQNLYAEQKAEIEALRSELKTERDLREKQKALLESLVRRFDELAASMGQRAGADAAKPAAIVPAVLQTSQTVEKAVAGQTSETTPKQQSDKANVVENGFGKIKFTGFIQGWYAAGDQGFGNTFRLRRAEMRFTGDLLPKVKWTVMFDLAKALSVNTTSTAINGTPVVRSVGVSQASRIFQEAYITLGYHKRANVSIGQFKIPLSQEGLQSTSTLDTVERALFLSDRSRGGGLGDARDLGVMLYGPLNSQVEYQFGVFNGTGESQNDVDQNKQKAFVGRLVFKPRAIKGLQIGTSGAWADRTQTLNPRHHRLGTELLYQRDRLRVKSELMTGIDGDVHRRGYYAHVGYRFWPKVEPIFRFDVFDPDTGRESTAATATERDFITGFNYYIKENNFKLQFNYLRKTFANSVTPSRNLFLVNLQTAW